MNKLQTQIFQAAKAGAESNLLTDGRLALIAVCADPATPEVEIKMKHFAGDSPVMGFIINNVEGSNPREEIHQLIDAFKTVCVVAEIWGAPALGAGHANHLAPSQRTDRYEGISVTLYVDGLPVANAIRRFERGACNTPFFACDWMDTTSGQGYNVVMMNGRSLPDRKEGAR